MRSHYLHHCWNILNWTLGNKFQWNFHQNTSIFIQENVLMRLKMSSGKCPFCLGLHVLRMFNVNQAYSIHATHWLLSFCRSSYRTNIFQLRYDALAHSHMVDLRRIMNYSVSWGLAGHSAVSCISLNHVNNMTTKHIFHWCAFNLKLRIKHYTRCVPSTSRWVRAKERRTRDTSFFALTHRSVQL